MVNPYHSFNISFINKLGLQRHHLINVPYMNNLQPEGKLTLREKEILSFIAEGLSSKQIAAKLIISENTVSNHRKNMLKKSGAKSSAELIYRIHLLINRQ
jgi:DNA-binding NarL/FixJ family response regulator